ncbi:hypothetical protein C2E31_21085 [Rhodopirellula baltica]|nr:hypothetical protein C2E31_21085 [Rhodopirellula baltica]
MKSEQKGDVKTVSGSIVFRKPLHIEFARTGALPLVVPRCPNHPCHFCGQLVNETEKDCNFSFAAASKSSPDSTFAPDCIGIKQDFVWLGRFSLDSC